MFIQKSMLGLGTALWLSGISKGSVSSSEKNKDVKTGKLSYWVLDVFTDEKYKGNQLSVVHATEELTLDQYHKISREFGYSETSFINYSEKEKALIVRSFTAADFEVVGAGHNLLGAVCLALINKWEIFKSQQGKSNVIIKDITIPLKVNQENGLPYVGMKQRPAKIIREVPIEVISQATGLSTGDLNLNGWKINIVQTEVAHLMVPVKDAEALQRAVSNKALLKEASKQYGFEGCYLFTTNPTNKEFIAEARFFNPSIGIDEDPATGTAAGPLTGYLEKLEHISRNKEYKILQGEKVKHPSVIRVNVTDEGVWVSGSSVIVMEGSLYL